MRVAHPSVWFQKSNKSPRPPDSDHLAPTNKADPRPSSATSFRSLVPSSTSYSNRSTPTLNAHSRPQDSLSHPFALMAHAPLPVVSSHDSSEDEEDCPVCLEPLSFSFRLPGEKPHIVPECGHALHEVCFFHLSSPCIVYGPLDSSLVLFGLKPLFFPRAFIPASPSTGIFYSTPCSARRLPPSFFPFRSSFTCESPYCRKNSEILTGFVDSFDYPICVLLLVQLSNTSIGLLYRRLWTCSRGKSCNCRSAQVESRCVRCVPAANEGW